MTNNNLGGSVAKNLAVLQNQRKLSQLGKLTFLLPRKMVQEGINYSLKVREENFCNTTRMCVVRNVMFLIETFQVS